MSKEKQCECCHEWWYTSDIKEGLCPNCYDYFKQLKQQLEEIKDECDLYKKFAGGGAIDLVIEATGRTREVEKLKQQLAEKQNTINETNKEFVQAVHDWKALCAEKDKEIESYKNKAYIDMLYKESLELKLDNQTQLAIQELEKVKEKIDCEMAIREYDISEQTADVCVSIAEQIDNQIKELKGE